MLATAVVFLLLVDVIVVTAVVLAGVASIQSELAMDGMDAMDGTDVMDGMDATVATDLGFDF